MANKKKTREKTSKSKSLISPEELLTRSFYNLPRELQIRIFSFFTPKELCNTVAPVCQEWWRLSQDPALWKSLKIYVRYIDDCKKLANLLKRGSSMLKKLKINTYWSAHLKEFAVASASCPNLTHLDLQGCDSLIDSRILCQFIENCQLIEELDVRNSYKIDKQVVSFIASLKNLRVLNLDSCHSIDDDCIKLISEKCTRLEGFNILGIYTITDKAIEYLLENSNSNLRRLEVGGFTLGYNFTDLALRRIHRCTKLQHLSIYSGQLLTDETLSHLKWLTGLQTLQLNAPLMTADALKNFFTAPHVSNLVTLELHRMKINDDGVHQITQNCKLLETLALSTCNDVTEVGLEYIVKHCRNLRSLDMVGLHLITGLCLNSVPQNLNWLVYLDLDCCEGIEQSILMHLAKRVPKMEIFDYYGDTVVAPRVVKKRNRKKNTADHIYRSYNLRSASGVIFREGYNLRSTVKKK